MAYDATLNSEVWSWYTAARAAADRPLAASILSLMSNQASTCRQVNESMQLAEAAQQAAADAPVIIQAPHRGPRRARPPGRR